MFHFFATSIIYVSKSLKTFHVFLMSDEICDWQLSPVYGYSSVFVMMMG